MAQHNRIAARYCRRQRFDAPVPMHNVSHRCKNMQTHNSTVSAKKRKSHPQPSVRLRTQIKQDSTAKRQRPEPIGTVPHASQLFFATELPFTWKNAFFFVQILTFKSHPWCSSSNAICQERLARGNQNRKTGLENKYPIRQALAQPCHRDLHRLNGTTQ